MAEAIDNERFRKLLLSAPSKALEWLYENYYASLVNIAFRLTGDRAAAKDIVQETFISVWQNHLKLGRHHDQSIQRYLVRIVTNQSTWYYKDLLRNDKLIRYLRLNQEEIEISPERRTINEDFKKEMRDLIATFPEREQECLLMRMDQEMTYPQIAAKLNVTVKAVERSLTQAHKRLREHWEGRI